MKRQIAIFCAGIAASLLASGGIVAVAHLGPLVAGSPAGRTLLGAATLLVFVGIYALGMAGLAWWFRRRGTELPKHALLVGSLATVMLAIIFMSLTIALSQFVVSPPLALGLGL